MKIVEVRDCAISKVPFEEAQSFVEENHRQKASKITAKINSIGLYLGSELLAVAQFCFPKENKQREKYTTELLRIAFKKNVKINGGDSALILHFIEVYKPADIFAHQENLEKVIGVCKQDDFTIFLEELGWHIEETSGNQLYEWINPNLTFYTYKITSSDSDKYYYGVSHVEIANATIEDCSNDGYFGSGAPKRIRNKFSNWKKAHFKNLKKEILSINSTKAAAYLEEKRIVGNLWKEDKDCLNSCRGGRTSSPSLLNQSLKDCHVHGETKHRGDTCSKCTSAKTKTFKLCVIHGETIFWGESCSKCNSISKINFKNCHIHGTSKHKGKICYKCENETVNSLKTCSTHGLTSHQGETCSACISDNKIIMAICPTHGMSKHQNSSCYKCMKERKNLFKVCEIHGLTKHYGETCAKCSLASTYTDGICNFHGAVRMRKGKCATCSAEKTAHTRFHSIPRDNCIHCSLLSKVNI